MTWESLTTDEVDRIFYLAGHLMSAEDHPDDAHAGDSRDLALDGFDELKKRWCGKTGERENTAYSCADSGHIFGPWHLERGLPKPSSSRVCVIPGCHEVEHKPTPIVRTTA